MSHELKRGTIRIISNYTRLLLTLMLGLLVVPYTIRWLGDDAFGIISLLGSNIGIASIFRQIIQHSLVRELGQAYHSDKETFRNNYAEVSRIALLCGALSLVSFGILFALVPLFQIQDHFHTPARIFVAGQALLTLMTILFAPMYNMYLVKERFIEYNIWYIVIRLGNPIAVLILGYAIVIDDPGAGLALYGLAWGVLASFGLVLASSIMMFQDRDLIPTYRRSTSGTKSQVVSTFSWNSGVQVAMNLHEQVPPLLLNLFSGTLANAAWGICFRFVAYIRMCTTGVQFGSDAVSARLAAGEDSEKSRRNLQRLINIQTKLTAMIALPATAMVFVYAWPIFDVWVGGSLQNYETVMSIAVYMTRILAVALVSRAVSDTWLLILYGAGFVKAYAPWIFAGGLFAPVASVILMLILPDPLVLYVPPAMFALVLATVHMIGLPIIAGRCLHISGPALLGALTRPLLAVLLATAAAIAVLYFSGRIGDIGFSGTLTVPRGEAIEWLWVLASIAAFGIVYAISSATFVLTAAERERIRDMIRKRRPSQPLE